MASRKITRMLAYSWISFIYFSLQFLQERAMSQSIDKQILDAAPKADMLDLLHLMPQGKVMVMTEFDLFLTLSQFKQLYLGLETPRPKRKAPHDTSARWTNGTVYYEIIGSLNTESNRQVIEEAINEWRKFSCLEFIQSTDKPNRIQFQNGRGCYSQLGMQSEPQELVLAPKCLVKGIIIHEIGHAIGWYHEHMRPDRDRFIMVDLNVVPTRFQVNFMKYGRDVINTYNIPYDYTSVMHYGNGIKGSITTLDPKYQDMIGQRQGMTFKDIKLANVMYECAKVKECPDTPCMYGGFVFFKSYKGSEPCQCWCDSGDVSDPLVLCSSMSREPVAPTPRPTELPSTKQCLDVREDCQSMKMEDADICMNKMEMMMASCAKTCDFCDKGEGMCMDYEKGCPLLAAAQTCQDPSLGPVMQMLCPASCGLCRPTNACKIQQELIGNGAMTPAIAWLSMLSLSLVGGVLQIH